MSRENQYYSIGPWFGLRCKVWLQGFPVPKNSFDLTCKWLWVLSQASFKLIYQLTRTTTRTATTQVIPRSLAFGHRGKQSLLVISSFQIRPPPPTKASFNITTNSTRQDLNPQPLNLVSHELNKEQKCSKHNGFLHQIKPCSPQKTCLTKLYNFYRRPMVYYLPVPLRFFNLEKCTILYILFVCTTNLPSISIM